MGMDKMRALAEVLGIGEDEDGRAAPVPMTADEADEFIGKHQPIPNLKVGDRVMLKKGMQQNVFPDYGEICVVTNVFNPPRMESAELGNDYSATMRDMALGFTVPRRGGGKRFIEFLYDSRGFERVE